MPGHRGAWPRTFLGRRVPPSFELRVVAIAPGRARDYDHGESRDAIVTVERGAIVLESSGGSRHRFRRGTLLCLTGLPLRALHNDGAETAVLLAVARNGYRPAAGVSNSGSRIRRISGRSIPMGWQDSTRRG